MTTESEQSSRAHRDEDWEPEWISGTFHGTLRCSAAKCREVVLIIGDYKVDADVDVNGRWQGDYTDFLRLKFTIPALPIIDLPAAAPAEVAEAITAAGQILWADPSAASNRLRFAVEALLTSKRVIKTRVSKGRRSRLTTHDRIVEFKKTDADAADALEAVKWIGNTGSHDDNVTVSDVLEGSKMLRK